MMICLSVSYPSPASTTASTFQKSENMCAARLHPSNQTAFRLIRLHSVRALAARSLTLSSVHPLPCKPRILAPRLHQALDTPTDGLRRPRAAHLGA